MGRPVRGGKRKGNNRHQESRRPKAKKGKFNYRESSYVKERDLKNEEIESRRKYLEQRNAKRAVQEQESSEDEVEDPMRQLLSTFNANSQRKVSVASESEDSEEELVQSPEPNKSQCKTEETDDSDVSNEEIIVRTKDEEENDAETALEDAGQVRDPFSLHLRNDLSSELYKVVAKQPQDCETHKFTWSSLGNLIYQIPKPKVDVTSETSLLDGQEFTPSGKVPSKLEKINWNNLYVKPQIQSNITRANYSNIKDQIDKNPSALTPLQKELFSIVNNYQDLYYPERTFANAEELRFIYCLHAVNHVLKTRTKVLHHNAKINKLRESKASDIPDTYRDQGLVRPKVLIIVPFRHCCLKIVQLLIDILIGEEKGGSVMNKKRFLEDFGGHELAMPKKNPKPEDYEETFRGNTDDTFRIGLSVTKKTLKLYSDFYSSDIVIASVLGLRMVVGAEGEDERDYDFLASIELLIMDQTELFLMQNWDHLIHVMDHMHLQPKASHGTDFSRLRSWCVNGWSKYYRQTLVFSSIQLPEIHAIFNKKCLNYAGKVKVVNPISAGSICQVVTQLPQVFHKLPVNSHLQSFEARMNFFVDKILPQYKDSIMNHTLIYVPSYFDFVKLRNYFKKEELSFVQICEYSKDSKVARARDMFYHSDAHFLIYSERFHYFRRIRVKGIRHLIFFALPTFPHFYSEMCNLMQEANQNPKSGSDSNMTVTCIYSKYDVQQLSAVLGTERAARMIASDKNVHMLMTGNNFFLIILFLME